jgi:hypothetical protein
LTGNINGPVGGCAFCQAVVQSAVALVTPGLATTQRLT